MATLIAVATDPRSPLNAFAYHVDGEEVVIQDLAKVEPVRYRPYRITPTQEAQIMAEKAGRMGWTITWAEGQEPGSSHGDLPLGCSVILTDGRRVDDVRPHGSWAGNAIWEGDTFSSTQGPRAVQIHLDEVAEVLDPADWRGAVG